MTFFFNIFIISKGQKYSGSRFQQKRREFYRRCSTSNWTGPEYHCSNDWIKWSDCSENWNQSFWDWWTRCFLRLKCPVCGSVCTQSPIQIRGWLKAKVSYDGYKLQTQWHDVQWSGFCDGRRRAKQSMVKTTIIYRGIRSSLAQTGSYLHCDISYFAPEWFFFFCGSHSESHGDHLLQVT